MWTVEIFVASCPPDRMPQKSLEDLLLVSSLLEATAQVLSEKLLCRREKLETVLRFGEPVSLIGEEHIFVINALALHGCNDLFGLGLFHTRIIGSLPDEYGYLDLVDLE